MKNPFKYPAILRYRGYGDAKKIAIMIRSSGIGDTVHMMSALAQKVRDGYDVTVCDDRPRRFMLEPLGVRFIARQTCSYSWEQQHRSEYGMIYSLYAAPLVPHYGSPDSFIGTDRAQWYETDLGDGWYFTGRNDSRFQLFANAIETTLPECFSWDCLRQPEHIENDILFSPWSHSNNRTASHWLNIRQGLKENFDCNIITIGTDKSFSRRFGIHVAPTLKQLVSYVQGARMVVAVDNGVLALALALQKPCVMIAGPHDHKIVFDQFKKYHEVYGDVVYPPPPGGCDMPCNWEKRKGFGVGGRCVMFADCMMAHTAETVVPAVKRVWNNGKDI